MPPPAATSLEPSAAERRLTSLPWSALAGLAPLLEPALAKLLDGAPAERVLDRFLRDHRELTAAQRQICAESLFGVGLWRRRLRAQCGLTEASPLQLLATLARDLGEFSEAPAALGVSLPPPSPPPADWRDRHSVPDWLADIFSRVATDPPSLAAAFNLPGPVCLRANRARVTREQLAEQLRTEGVETRAAARAPDALIVTSPRPNLFALQAARDGLFEVQDEGSQLIGALVDAQPGHSVLDLCAGAGGKSLQLAAAVGAQGRVVATDVDLARLERLRLRAERAGVIVHIAGRIPPTGQRFDRVLVDAPCSELGALRRGPDLRWRIDPSTFGRYEAIQRELLDRAAELVAPGGLLVYATCTLRPEENDAQVDRLLSARPSLQRAGELRTFPHLDGTDGFFAVAMRQLSAADHR